VRFIVSIYLFAGCVVVEVKSVEHSLLSTMRSCSLICGLADGRVDFGFTST